MSNLSAGFFLIPVLPTSFLSEYIQNVLQNWRRLVTAPLDQTPRSLWSSNESRYETLPCAEYHRIWCVIFCREQIQDFHMIHLFRFFLEVAPSGCVSAMHALNSRSRLQIESTISQNLVLSTCLHILPSELLPKQ
jgi:hypothetical protein